MPLEYPRTTAALIARKTRVFVGNRQVADHAPPAAGTDGVSASDRTGWVRAVAHQPARLVDLPAFLAITVIAKWRAARRLAARDFSWDRDETTRVAGGPHG